MPYSILDRDGNIFNFGYFVPDDPTETYETVSADNIAGLGTDLIELKLAVSPSFTYFYHPTNDNLYMRGYKNTDILSYGLQFYNYETTPAQSATVAFTKAAGIAEIKSVSLMTAVINGIETICVLAYCLMDGGYYRYLYHDATLYEGFDTREFFKAWGQYTPYEPPEVGGGAGLGDTSSDPVDFPELPLVSALSTGMVRMYRGTGSQMQNFSEYLWTSDFVETVKKLLSDPLEALISVQIVPYSPPQAENPADVYISWINSGVQMYPLSNQFTVLNCGTLEVTPFWDSFLDYPPNTEVSIYLPYIGVKNLSVQDVMGRTIELRYHIDILSGSCIAMLKCSGNNLNSVLYSWPGTCGVQIPVTSRDFSSIITSALSYASNAAVALSIGKKAAITQAVVGGGISAGAAAISDTHVRQGGSIGSASSYLGIQKPYLIINRPIDSTPQIFNESIGRPSNYGGKLSDFYGYLECSYVHVEPLTATEPEKSEIERLLKSGILI